MARYVRLFVPHSISRKSDDESEFPVHLLFAALGKCRAQSRLMRYMEADLRAFRVNAIPGFHTT